MFAITPLIGAHEIIVGLCVGFLFGFLLHKGGVTKFDVIINQFRLRDFTLIKIMLTAILVGGVGVYALEYRHVADFNIKPANMLAILIGGGIFGIGIAILGYCPGTAVGSVGGGSAHGLVGVIGMLVGAALFAEAYDTLGKWQIFTSWQLRDLKMTFPKLLNIDAWTLWPLIAAGIVLLFLILELILPAKKAA
jgi:hypothetical protein